MKNLEEFQITCITFISAVVIICLTFLLVSIHKNNIDYYKQKEYIRGIEDCRSGKLKIGW